MNFRNTVSINKRLLAFLIFSALFFLGLSSLSAQGAVGQKEAEEPAEQESPSMRDSKEGEEELPPIRIGILPDADSLPFLVAEHEGLYEDFGAPIELVNFRSPVERDAAFQAGKLDGMIGDTLGALFLEQGGEDITVTSNTSGRYGIAAAPGSDVSSLEDMKNEPIGISSNTIIEYAVHALFSKAGIADDHVSVQAVAKIPIRMELLLQGAISGACLPEPLYSLVIARGAVPVQDTTALKSAPGILLFSSEIVKERKEALQAIYLAYDAAGKRIDADPDAYRDFLVDHAGFPPDVRDSYDFVTYGRLYIPGEEEIAEVEGWMLEKNLLDEPLAYEELVSAAWDLEFLD
ncbi:MAG: ABC transporter substrate-binding protein [Spirochaetales bacterium]|nr:ABC transporter substrate-binding protein [Spirochaetales bacterium]